MKTKNEDKKKAEPFGSAFLVRLLSRTYTLEPPEGLRKAASIRTDQIATMFSACGPFWPLVTVNDTRWPSTKVLKPEPVMALKCANTSGPDSCSIKPKPFASLNHLTVPVVVFDINKSCEINSNERLLTGSVASKKVKLLLMMKQDEVLL